MEDQKVIFKKSVLHKFSFWQLEKQFLKLPRNSIQARNILSEMLKRAVTFRQCQIVYKLAVVCSWIQKAAFRKMSKYAIDPYQLKFVYNNCVTGSIRKQATLHRILEFDLTFDEWERLHDQPDSSDEFKKAMLPKMSESANSPEECASVYFKASPGSSLKLFTGRKMLEIDDATYDQWDRINRRAHDNFDSWLEKATLQKMLEKSITPDQYEVVYFRSVPGSDFRGRILLEVSKIDATFNQWDRVYLSAEDTCDNVFLKIINNKCFESATTFKHFKSVYERAGSDKKLKKASLSRMKIHKRERGDRN